VAGHDDENISCALETSFEVWVCDEVGRKADAWKIAGVFTIGRHGLEQVEFEQSAQAHVASTAGKLQRQRRSPGTGADDGNILCDLCAYQCFSNPSASC